MSVIINKREAKCCANCKHIRYDVCGAHMWCDLDESISIEFIDVCDSWGNRYE